MTRWTASDIPDLSGRRAVVTGASSGIGLVTAEELARHGAAVVLAVRDHAKGEAALDRIRVGLDGAAGAGPVTQVHLDLADLGSVHRFASDIGRDPLHLLVNNAGVMAIPRRLTADGFEMQLGTNHLGHVALTLALLPALVRGGGTASASRVVTVSSSMHRAGRIDVADLMGERRYGRWRAYSQSKLANLHFAFELQRRLDSAGLPVASYAAHPGYAATNLQAVVPRCAAAASAPGSPGGATRFSHSPPRWGPYPASTPPPSPGSHPGATSGRTASSSSTATPGSSRRAPRPSTRPWRRACGRSARTSWVRGSPTPRPLPEAEPRAERGEGRDRDPVAPLAPHVWRVMDSNHRRQSRRIYSPLPLAARATRLCRPGTAQEGYIGRAPSAKSPYGPHDDEQKGPGPVMADSSFDIVSKVDRQEVDNALNQAAKELAQRFDFKNTGSSIEWKGELAVEITASTEERVAAALDVFRDKLVKRQISLKSLTAEDPRSSGKEYKISCTFTAGISQEQAKKLGKLIRDEGPKSVKAQVMGEELRVTSKSRDDLQAVQSLVKDADLDFAVQFVNYR